MYNSSDVDQIISNNNIKLLIFDCDGTIMDTLAHHYAAWIEACGELNYQFIPQNEFINDYAGVSGADMLRAVANKYSFTYDIDQVILRKRNYFLDKHIYNVNPINKTLQFAYQYYGKLKLAVASGGAQAAVEKMLLIHKVDHLFDTVITFDLVPNSKPAPDIFLRTATEMNIPPGECLVFEDHHAGFNAAINAKMPYIDINQLTEK